MFKVGEKGDEYLYKETDDMNPEDDFMQELDDIASICVAAMKWKDSTEDIEMENRTE